MKKSEVEQFHHAWSLLLVSSFAFLSRQENCYSSGFDDIVTCDLILYRADAKKKYYYDILKQITEIPPIQSDVNALGSALSSSYVYVENVALRLELWKQGVNGPYDALECSLDSFNDIIASAIYNSNSCEDGRLQSRESSTQIKFADKSTIKSIVSSKGKDKGGNRN